MIDLAVHIKELLLEVITVRAELEEQMATLTDMKTWSTKFTQAFYLDQLISNLQWLYKEVGGK